MKLTTVQIEEIEAFVKSKYVDFKNITGTQFHKFSTAISLSLSNIPEKKALFILWFPNTLLKMRLPLVK